MKNKIIIALTILLVNSCSPTMNYIDYVDPMIGTGGHGHVFVGASVPHGMVQVGPNNLSKGWDWCSGYHDSDNTIVGFSHTHLSGTGIADLGDIVFMPITGTPSILQHEFYSTFNKKNEKAKPHLYSVLLDKYRIKAELTASDRVAYHRYSYPNDADKIGIIVDLLEGVKSLEARKGALQSFIHIENDTTLVGYRKSNEWAQDHRVYFAAHFSQAITNYQLYSQDTTASGNIISSDNTKVRLLFTNNGKPIQIKVAISYTSIEGAQLNMQAEKFAWNFDKVVQIAKKRWNTALSVIDYQCNNHDEKKIFYTALYHTQILPSLFCDVDGTYRGADGKNHIAKHFKPYSIFSLWDTYRAVHPLYTLIDLKNTDYIHSLLAINNQQKRMPVWHLAGNETDCMVGVHSIPVIVDAILKGAVTQVNEEQVYKDISAFENYTQEGLNYVKTQSYIPAEKITWSVAKALEYCIDDYAIAQLAKHLGKDDDYQKFLARSKNYKHYFDSSTGFMRGKMSDGKWRTPFNPYHSLHLEDDYVEGNAWQYTWLVPHDVEGLIALFGDHNTFFTKFDSLFTVSSELNEEASVDITGMIGQYAHGNEPSHHTLYLHTLAGKPHRTADLLREVYQRFYHASPDGLIGNEDCGQMSAWYIFSALGFYPVNPVSGDYVFGSPLVKKATLKLNNGNTFTIVANNNSPENKYIRSIKLNGKDYSGVSISHATIMQGGRLEFEMSKHYN